MTQVYDPHADWAREDAEIRARAENAEARVAQLEETLTECQAAYERLMAARQGQQPDSPSPLIERLVSEALEKTYPEGWLSQVDAVLNTINVVIYGHNPARGGQR